jgi:hypothetical protein
MFKVGDVYKSLNNKTEKHGELKHGVEDYV